MAEKDQNQEKASKVKEKVESSVELSKDAQKVLEMVEKMTVLELSDLVKALEDKFGVSAQTSVMVAGGTVSAETPEAVEEKSEYDVVIKAAGDQKIAVIKAVRELDQNLGLVDAKNLVEKGDAVVLSGVKKDVAEQAKKKLEDAGASVELA